MQLHLYVYVTLLTYSPAPQQEVTYIEFSVHNFLTVSF